MTPDAPATQDAVWHEAVNTRDPAFDGVFFVAVTSTRIYCRPVCPSRLARPENRRFFVTPADAERAGFRACRRCRPELAPGHSPIDAVPRLAQQALTEITDGALNGDSVTSLANTLGMSDRQLRRAVRRELGATPSRLAAEQRLRSATELLTVTRHSITHIAYASGFQSVRRFNAVFRQRYEMSPTAWRQRVSKA